MLLTSEDHSDRVDWGVACMRSSRGTAELEKGDRGKNIRKGYELLATAAVAQALALAAAAEPLVCYRPALHAVNLALEHAGKENLLAVLQAWARLLTIAPDDAPARERLLTRVQESPELKTAPVQIVEILSADTQLAVSISASQ